MHHYNISCDPALVNLGAVHDFLTRSAWSPGIPAATVARAVRNSLCVGAYLDGQQVGFARVVTDSATFAYLADVYVLEAHRGQGLALRMVQELLQQPQLQGLRRVLLATRDAQGLYAKLCFKPLAAPGHFMEKHKPDAYLVP